MHCCCTLLGSGMRHIKNYTCTSNMLDSLMGTLLTRLWPEYLVCCTKEPLGNSYSRASNLRGKLHVVVHWCHPVKKITSYSRCLLFEFVQRVFQPLTCVCMYMCISAASDSLKACCVCLSLTMILAVQWAQRILLFGNGELGSNIPKYHSGIYTHEKQVCKGHMKSKCADSKATGNSKLLFVCSGPRDKV